MPSTQLEDLVTVFDETDRLIDAPFQPGPDIVVDEMPDIPGMAKVYEFIHQANADRIEAADLRRRAEREREKAEELAAKPTATWFPPPANDNKRGSVVFMGEPSKYTPQPELVRDTIPRNGVGFFGGQSGAWKTFFSLHAGTCFMTGEPLAGRNIERIGGVVYLAAEGAGTIEGRMAARRKRLANPSEILPFYRVDGLGAIIDARGYSALEQRCAEAAEDCRERFDLPLVALFIDTVAAAGMIAEDKENDPGAWQKVFDGLQPIATRLDIVIILIHHAGKNAAAGLRGSSNARAGADFALMLSCDRDELTGKSANHFLSLSKSRDAPEGPIASIRAEPVVIGYRDDQSPVTSLTLDFGLGEAPAAKGKKPTRAEQDFMSALGRTELDRVRVRGESDAPLVQAAKLADVRCEFDAVYVTAEADGAKAKDARRNQFKRGLAAAVKRRAVHTGTWADTEWVWFAEADSDSDGLNRTQSE